MLFVVRSYRIPIIHYKLLNNVIISVTVPQLLLDGLYFRFHLLSQIYVMQVTLCYLGGGESECYKTSNVHHTDSALTV